MLYGTVAFGHNGTDKSIFLLLELVCDLNMCENWFSVINISPNCTKLILKHILIISISLETYITLLLLT